MAEIVVRKRRDCNEPELAALTDLAAKGEEVDRNLLESGIRERARNLFWIENEQGIVAMAALKVPYASYSSRVFRESKADAKAEDYPLELGYIYVDKALEGQGLGSRLVERALQESGSEGVFATTREGNVAMRRVLKRFDFVQVGQPYWSKRQKCNLVLYTYAIAGD